MPGWIQKQSLASEANALPKWLRNTKKYETTKIKFHVIKDKSPLNHRSKF